MAKYSNGAGADVKRAMQLRNAGKVKIGKGGPVKSRKQAISIGLSEARASASDRRKSLLMHFKLLRSRAGERTFVIALVPGE